MQYTQLKQVIDIDSQITNLHHELSNLYAKRALFANTNGFSNIHVPLRAAPNKGQEQDPWIMQTYLYVTNAWISYGIAIPSLAEINKKMVKAHKIIRNISASDQALGEEMGVLLVPPSNVLSFPISNQLRRSQKHILLQDYMNADMMKINGPPKKTWQVLVAHIGKKGLSYGSAAEILKYKKYLIGVYDMRAMGLREYTALTLQVNQIIDQDVWTVLLGEKAINNMLVPSVTFMKGQYRFDLDESNSILGEETFRPALEVKA